MEIKKVCVVGLGYVGLPLAVTLSKYFSVIGFDIKQNRIQELKENIDSTGELSPEELNSINIEYTAFPEKIKEADFIIVAVPTPVDKHNNPDLSPLISASELVGKNLNENSVVVYESTVYPGCTEEVAIPVLEKHSGLKSGVNFSVGYSPERINPGDKEHSIHKVTKIVSGMDLDTLNKVDYVYGKVTKTHRASSVKVAEAAKVIENIQRDLNIALMNELSIIFNKIGIDTKEVLDAAATKWNFHRYYPGLVGGHCIGVDPYYLTYKAQELGYHPEVILAGRRINDNLHKHIVELIMKKLNQFKKPLSGSRILILGLTFKENVKDYRNSRVKHLIEELKHLEIDVVACDPLLDKSVVEREFGVINYKFKEIKDDVDCAILAVGHNEFRELSLNHLKEMMGQYPILIDLQHFYDKKEALEKGFVYESL